MIASIWDFHVHTDVDACDCTRGLHWHRKRVCTESWLWEKNPLPQRGLEPASVLCLVFQADALPTALSPPQLMFQLLLLVTPAVNIYRLQCVALNRPKRTWNHIIITAVGGDGDAHVVVLVAITMVVIENEYNIWIVLRHLTLVENVLLHFRLVQWKVGIVVVKRIILYWK